MHITSQFMKLGPVHDVLGSGAADRANGFRPTSNARNERMMDDLQQFARHLRKMQSSLMSVQNQVAGQFEVMRNVLVTALPRCVDLLTCMP